MAIVTDITDLAQLTEFARRDVPTPANFVLNQFLPDVTIDGIEVDLGTLSLTNRAAKYRAYDAETPIGKRDTFTTSKAKIPALGQKLVVGEYETIQLAKARAGGGTNSQLVNQIYDDTANNVRAIRTRAELARGDVLVDGKFTLSDENGLTLEYDAGVDSSHIVSAGTSWATVASADPVEEMRGWQQTFVDDSGEPAAFALTSNRVLGYLLRNAAIRSLVGSVTGAPNIVTRDQLNQVLSAHGLPQIVTYDTNVDVAGSTTRVIADDKVIFLPANGRSLGRTVWGITAEALELVEAGFMKLQDAPGITSVTLKDGDPVRVWSKSTATCMPVIDDPRKILIADVVS